MTDPAGADAVPAVSEERLAFIATYTEVFTANPGSIYQTYMYTEQDVAEIHAMARELLAARQHIKHAAEMETALRARLDEARQQLAEMRCAACDEVSNSIQWLKNVRDGVSDAESAIRDMEAGLARVQTATLSPRVISGEHAVEGMAKCECGHAKRPDMPRCLNCIECGRNEAAIDKLRRLHDLLDRSGELLLDAMAAHEAAEPAAERTR
jgi:hypothetical protein